MQDDDNFNYSDVEDDDIDDAVDDSHDSSSSMMPHDDRATANNNHGGSSNTTTTTTNTTNTLLSLVQSYDWPAVLGRLVSHPHESTVCDTAMGRTPLHTACDHDAPAVVVAALLKANRDASIRTGTTNMTPLHITCSSSHASVHVVRVLLERGRHEPCGMRDVDGDVPLHAACRCGAPMEVLDVLVRAFPGATHMRDYEGLTPLLRLWVRYFVILGADVMEGGVTALGDLQGDLLLAWQKTELLLQCAHQGSLVHPQGYAFRTLHAAAAVDCPRAIVRIAAQLYPHQLEERDELGRTPLMIACAAMVYPVHDLSDAGYLLDDVIHEEDTPGWVPNSSNNNNNTTEASSSLEPLAAGQPHTVSVIELLLQMHTSDPSHGASWTDPSGRLPLHMAIETGKEWHHGIRDLVHAWPDSVSVADRSSKLFPYQLAGSKGDLSTTFELLRRNPNLLERDHRKQQHAAAAVQRDGKSDASSKDGILPDVVMA